MLGRFLKRRIYFLVLPYGRAISEPARKNGYPYLADIRELRKKFEETFK
jgi:hypothetical protein